MATVRFATPKTRVGESFGVELKREVDQWFTEQGRSSKATPGMVIKGALMTAVFFGSFVAILFGGFSGSVMLGLCVLMGVAYAGVGFCVGHDAVHGSYFKSSKWNRRLGYIFDFVGASSYLWRLTHNRIHHTWTNVPGIDEDIQVSPQVRLSPEAPRSWYHRFQHFYAWPLYGLATINWVLVKDYQQLFAKKLGPYTPPKHPRGEVIRLFAFKLVYLAWTIALPLAVLDVTIGQFILGYVLVHFVAGLILGVTFQLAHVVEEAHYPRPNDEGRLATDWHAHQLLTTCDFATRNRFVTWFVGGLNHQIEHHLLPQVCSAHYAKLRPLVKRLAQKHGLPHYEAPTIRRALRSHHRMLRRLGRTDDAGIAAV